MKLFVLKHQPDYDRIMQRKWDDLIPRPACHAYTSGEREENPCIHVTTIPISTHPKRAQDTGAHQGNSSSSWKCRHTMASAALVFCTLQLHTGSPCFLQFCSEFFKTPNTSTILGAIIINEATAAAMEEYLIFFSLLLVCPDALIQTKPISWHQRSEDLIWQQSEDERMQISLCSLAPDDADCFVYQSE